MTSARDKLKRFFVDNKGRTIAAKELFRVAGINSYARRIRELRQDGWPILTSNDLLDLKPGEYRMDDDPPPANYHFVKGMSQKTRAEILERNGYTCQMCGAGAGEPRFNDPNRKVRLHIGHIVDKSHGGSDEPTNLRALCSSCNEGAKNLTAEPPRYVWLLSQVRRASIDDQRTILDWLKKRLRDY